MLQNTGPIQHFMAAPVVFVSALCWGPEIINRLCSVSALPGALAVGAQTSSEMTWLGCVRAVGSQGRSTWEQCRSWSLCLQLHWGQTKDCAWPWTLMIFPFSAWPWRCLSTLQQLNRSRAVQSQFSRGGLTHWVLPAFGPSATCDDTASSVQLKQIHLQGLAAMSLFYFKIQ